METWPPTSWEECQSDKVIKLLHSFYFKSYSPLTLINNFSPTLNSQINSVSGKEDVQSPAEGVQWLCEESDLQAYRSSRSKNTHLGNQAIQDLIPGVSLILFYD